MGQANPGGAVMFAGWQAFYEMTGGAAATLTGLMFIVASLATGRRTTSAAAAMGQRLFTTPTVFHLVSVLVISALVLVPDGEGGSQIALMVGWSAWGLIYGLSRLVGIMRLSSRSHRSDFWWYGFGPGLAHVALAAASLSAWLGAPRAAYFVALCLMVLLVVAIRNAWDLVTWLAPRREDG